MRSLTHCRKAVRMAAATAAGALLVSACAPGATSEADKPSKPVNTDIGAKPVTLNLLVTSGTDVPFFTALGKRFHARHANVTVKVTSQDYGALTTNIARILAGSDVPDLVRVPQFGNLINNRLLTNLDPYAKAYGWDDWPRSQFASTRVAADGRQRGTGSLYGAGPGFGLTGVYYDKALAQRIGMSRPPATVAEFEELLAKAKGAGLQPIMINGKDGGTMYPLQNLQMAYAGNAQGVQDWNFAKPGASIDTPATVKAATTLHGWAQAGYLPTDVNAIDQTKAPAEFIKGKTVFLPSGNWRAPELDKAGPGKFGFFLFPPGEAGGSSWAMTAAATLGIPTKSPNADVAAAFLDFVQTDPQARQDTVTLGGLVPAGPADGAVPTAPTGSAVGATVAAFQALLKSDGLVGFMADATASINVNTLVPQTQLLLSGKTSPKAFAAKVQDDYERDLGR
ncbi:ABC transporter substrate-binding protein [Actinomadura rugatobispora]|uniref:ABC transporter substrate-binding protein n=1 Tax=Actinomadura rugatobispora TaxID=1994 RepID=A0ABW0ZXB6_9ACTN|nr:extracellular solute-binding protein [Actinomadura rugatobispora]